MRDRTAAGDHPDLYRHVDVTPKSAPVPVQQETDPVTSAIDRAPPLMEIGNSARARVLGSVQRLAGNRATEWLLSIQREVAFAPAIALSAKDLDALADQVHTGVADRNKEWIFVALEKLGKDQPTIDRLKTRYRALYRAELEAALRGVFAGRDLQMACELINIKADARTPDIVGKKPTTDDEYTAVVERLSSALTGASRDIDAVFGSLMPFNRDRDALDKLKTAYQTWQQTHHRTTTLDDDIKGAGLDKDQRSYALYLLNAPPPGRPHTAATVDDAGTEGFSANVPGGAVSAHTGTKYTRGGRQRPAGFSIGYEGGLASESHWLQFIWREIIVTNAAGAERRLNDPITTSGGHYNLTTDPAHPVYNTDSDPPNPFYESTGISNRTAEATTIFDYPGEPVAWVNREFRRGASRVVSRAHFNSFLIRDYKTLERVSIDIEWTFNSLIPAGAPPAGRTYATSGAKVDKLPDDMKTVLVAQFPAFDYIQ